MRTYRELMELFAANQIPEAGIVILLQETTPDDWKEIAEKVRKGGWRQL